MPGLAPDVEPAGPLASLNLQENIGLLLDKQRIASAGRLVVTKLV
jgi:hypothetical protein